MNNYQFTITSFLNHHYNIFSIFERMKLYTDYFKKLILHDLISKNENKVNIQ
jgi:hypothetical protein